MNIRLFNKTYWVRRFGEQKVVKGYVTSGYSDFQASLHIHPHEHRPTASLARR